jgi:mannitol-1-phosphate 5-dehydrogenase
MANAVIYGAGNIGRGFIGPLFVKSGYRVSYIDIDEKIISSLQKNRRYPIRLLSNDESEEFWIDGVNAINGVNTAEVIDYIAKTDIMATAVGVRILPLIAPNIAAGLKKRFEQNTASLNIIICENLINADKYLEELIKKYLEKREIKQLEKTVGFVEASIGRMVPIQTPEMQDGNILRICSEKYGFLPVNKNAFVGEIPVIEGLSPFSNFDFFIQRKIFIHNMGHATCAYLGLLLGNSYISESIARADVLFIVQNAMLESASALQRKFDVHLQDMIDHIHDLLCRFNNHSLKDTCVRVGADIERKLGPSDRFIGAITCCKEQGVIPAFISIGAATAIHYLIKERKLEQTEENVLSILEKTSEMRNASAEKLLILDMYHGIRQGPNLERLIHFALDAGKKSDVI